MRNTPSSAARGIVSRLGYRARFLALAAVTSAGPILVLAMALGRGATDNVTLVVIEALG